METFANKVQYTKKQATEALDVLAAACYQQMMDWQEYYTSIIALRDKAAYEAIENGDTPDVLLDLLTTQSSLSVKLAEDVLGPFSDVCPKDMLLQVKLDSSALWFQMISKMSSAEFDAWLSIQKGSFVQLPRLHQRSSYYRASLDLLMISDYFKIDNLKILVAQNLMEPLGRLAAQKRNLQHKIGMHGASLISEEPWSTTCLACNRTRGAEHYSY